MTITSVSTNINAIKPYERVSVYRPCITCVDTDKLVKVGYKVREDYSEEHRSFPADLLSNLTARPKIRTIDSFWGADKASKYKCTSGGSCYVYQYAWFTKALQFGFLGDASDEVPVTNWELDVREAIESRRQNIAESLYEWRQTASLVGEGAQLLKTGWQIWRGKLPKAARRKISPCDIATAELTASFGVNPLLAEIKEAYTKLTDKVGVGLAQRVKTTSTAETLKSVSASLWYGDYHWKRVDKVSLLARYKEIAPAVFTAGAPWELAWEITPFSWLVDGFIDIGSYLGSLDSMFDVLWVKGTRTQRDRKFAYGQGKRYTTSITVSPERYREKVYERVVLTSIPLPRPPRFQPTQNWRKLMHAVSTLVVLNGKCSKRPKTTAIL